MTTCGGKVETLGGGTSALSPRFSFGLRSFFSVAIRGASHPSALASRCSLIRRQRPEQGRALRVPWACPMRCCIALRCSFEERASAPEQPEAGTGHGPALQTVALVRQQRRADGASSITKRCFGDYQARGRRRIDRNFESERHMIAQHRRAREHSPSEYQV